MNTTNLTFLDSIVKMPLMPLPVRSTIVTIGANKILFTPGSRLTDSDYQKISGITDIVSPNKIHGAGVRKAIEHFPQARVWAAPGLREKRPNIPWTGELGLTPWPYQNDLPMYHIKGMPELEEVVFVHKASRSLIVGDLAFYMKETKGIGAWIILHLFGTYHRFGVSRLFNRYTKDKAAVNASLEEILRADFDQIIICHGSNLESDAKNQLRGSLRERGFL